MESGNLPIMTFADLFINDTINCWLNEELLTIDMIDIHGNLFFKIENQTQFATVAECNCELPTLNFDDYTLLMGTRRIEGSGTLGSQKVYLNCDYPQANYTIHILVDTSTAGFSIF